MALYRCGSSGGTLSETTLWNNPNPTSDFAAQTITLNYGGVTHNISTYDYIAVDYKISKELSDVYRVIYRATEVVSWQSASASTYVTGGIILGRTTGSFKRIIQYVSNTQLSFEAGANINGSSTKNSACIPIRVIGIK